MMCEFTKVDDIMLKVLSGVAVVVLVATLAFGMKVYAFMESGDRFTAEDGVVMEDELRDDLVSKELYERDQEYWDERFDRLESKLDLLIQER